MPEQPNSEPLDTTPVVPAETKPAASPASTIDGQPPTNQEVADRVVHSKFDPQTHPDAIQLEGRRARKQFPKFWAVLTRFLTPMQYKVLWLGIALVSIAGCGGPSTVVVMGNMVDQIATGASQEDINFYAGMFVLIGGVSFMCCWAGFSCLYWTSEHSTTTMRRQFLRAVMSMEMGFTDINKPGALNARIAGDVRVIQVATGMIYGLFIMNLASAVAGLAVGLTYGWQVTLLVIGVAVPTTTLIRIIAGMWIVKTMRLALESYAQAGDIAEEILTGMRTVQSFNAMRQESSRYERAIRAAKKFGIVKGFAMGLAMGGSGFFAQGVIALAGWFSAWLVRNDAWNPLEQGAWTGANALISLFGGLMATMGISGAFLMLPFLLEAQGAADVLFQVVNRKSKIDAFSKDGLQLAKSKLRGEIAFEGVEFEYPVRPGVQILKGVDIKVGQGKKVALVGASGSGKSTSVGLLLRFYDPKGGKVTVDGRELSAYNLQWWRRQVGYVGQEPVLFAMSLLDNIRMGRPDATEEEVMEAAKKANAFDFVSKLPEGFHTVLGDTVTLSGGQKQRVAIARALLKDPAILILDEATSALDTQSERIVQAALDKLMEGRTVLMIAHRLSTVVACDAIYVMDKGQVVEVGTHPELIAKNGLYSELVRRQEVNEAADQDPQDPVDAQPLPSSGHHPDEPIFQGVPLGRRGSKDHGPVGHVGSRRGSKDAGQGTGRRQSFDSLDLAVERLSSQLLLEALATPASATALGGASITSHTLGTAAALAVPAPEDDGVHIPPFHREGAGTTTHKEQQPAVVVVDMSADRKISTAAERKESAVDRKASSVTGRAGKAAGPTLVAQAAAELKKDIKKRKHVALYAHEEGGNWSDYKVPYGRLIKIMWKGSPGYFVMGAICSFLGGGAAPVFGVLFARMLMYYFQAQGVDVICKYQGYKVTEIDACRDDAYHWATYYSSWFALVGFGNLVFTTLGHVGWNALEEVLAYELRKETMDSLLRQHIGFFDEEKNKPRVLLAALEKDASLVRNCTTRAWCRSVQCAGTIVGAGIIALVAYWKLALVVMSLFSAAIIMLLLQDTMLGKHTGTNELNVAGAISSEALSNLRTVASYTFEDNVIWRFEGYLNGAGTAAIHNGNVTGFSLGFLNLVSYSMQSLGLWYGNKVATNGECSFQDLIQCVSCLMVITNAILPILISSPERPIGYAACQRTFQLIDAQSQIDPETDEGERTDVKTGVVQGKDLVFAYPTRPKTNVLTGLNLDCLAGQTTALVGASGCGKSTVTAMLLKYYEQKAGSLDVDGQSVLKANPKHLREQIITVGQEPTLFALSVLDNIRYGMPNATLEQCQAAAKLANIHDFIMKLPDQYETNVGMKGSQLSGGQKQRVAIARALVMNPKLLLLDEATSALDSESEAVVQEALDAAAAGRTTITIAHRLATIQKAERICFIHEGKVTEMGTHDELVALQGRYHKLVLAQKLGIGEMQH